MASGDFDASVVGGPKGASAIAFTARKAAEAQARLDALAAAGQPFVPTYRRIDDASSAHRRALDAAMGAEWQAMTLDTFNAYTSDLRNAALVVATFIDRPAGFLYLYGDVGTGKTHLAAGAAIRLVERGYPVRVYRAADVAGTLRRAAGEGHGAFETIMGRLKHVRVLVLDDFGSEHMTEFMAAEWFDLLDHRYRIAAATILTANVHPDSLNMPRLASRLQDERLGSVIGVAAKDYRALSSPPALHTKAGAFAPPAQGNRACESCGGTGRVRRDLPVGHPDFGKAFPCPDCAGCGEPLANGGH